MTPLTPIVKKSLNNYIFHYDNSNDNNTSFIVIVTINTTQILQIFFERASYF